MSRHEHPSYGHDHEHEHEHGHHDHHHHHHEERLPEAGHPAGLGPAVLDIGGDIGALVATMNYGTAGTELYLRPDRDPATTVHTGVWERDDSKPSVTAAVFAELHEGTYQVLDEHGTAVRTVEIHGGSVATIDLRN